MIDDRFHKEPFIVDSISKQGRYLGVPVIVVRDDNDGFVVALWPDRIKPRRSHGKDKPFTYHKGEWWRLIPEQIKDDLFEYIEPIFPLILEPKKIPDIG